MVATTSKDTNQGKWHPTAVQMMSFPRLPDTKPTGFRLESCQRGGWGGDEGRPLEQNGQKDPQGA